MRQGCFFLLKDCVASSQPDQAVQAPPPKSESQSVRHKHLRAANGSTARIRQTGNSSIHYDTPANPLPFPPFYFILFIVIFFLFFSPPVYHHLAAANLPGHNHPRRQAGLSTRPKDAITASDLLPIVPYGAGRAKQIQRHRRPTTYPSDPKASHPPEPTTTTPTTTREHRLL